MQLGFVHFDQSDQKKYLAVLSRISEGGAIDELGIGRIRDFYSDQMFPGISTLHQHAKYFALMPLLYREAVKSRFDHLGDVRSVIRNLEIALTRRLVDGSPGASGITGSDALKTGSYVKYDPMYIYGTALRSYGIVKTDNLEGAIFYASKKSHERPVKLKESEEEQGDSDDLESYLNFCVCPTDLGYNWLEKCSLELSPSEASFVQKHIVNAPICKGTILHFLLENCKVSDFEDVYSYETFVLRFREILSEEHIALASRAGHFSDLVYGLFLRYNWLFSNEKDDDIKAEFESWYKDAFLPGKMAMANSLVGVRINDNGSLVFCRKAIELMEQKNWSDLDYLIKQRERKIKISNYKIGNSRFTYDRNNPIHYYKLGFRWGTVRTIVSEILGGLEDE